MTSTGVRIVDEIRRAPGGLSKKELAAATGLPWGTLFKAVGRLTGRGVLQPCPSRAGTPGRPSIPLILNADAAYFGGLDVGAATTRILFCDLGFRIRYRRTAPTERYTTKERFLAWLDGLFSDALAEAKIVRSRLAGVGVAVSGNVDTDRGVIVSGGNFGMKYGADIAVAPLAERWGAPIHAVTTAVGAAAAEYHFGQYAHTGNLITLGLGVGIGSGVVANHQLLISQPHRPVGHIGHVLIPGNRHRCCCGFLGCLEAYSGGEYLKGIVREELPGRDDLADAAALDRAAAGGDPDAVRIMTTAAAYNAVGIAGMVQLYSPEVMVFSGGQSKPEGFLYNTTLAKLRQILPEERRTFAVSITTLGEFQSALGAARLAYEQFF